MIVTDYCNICDITTHQSFRYEKWGFNIYKCANCGAGYVKENKDFSPEKIYNEEYFQGGRKDGYDDYLRDEHIFRNQFKKAVRKILKFSNRGARLLEIGSAYGFFLQEASAYYQCFGIEISKAAAQFAVNGGMNVYNAEINENLLKKIGPFDVVAMLDVIEHLPNPFETLRIITRHLNKGGIFLITTGDFNSLYSKISGKWWRLMTPPQHLYFFTKRSIIILCERLGLEVVNLERPWKLVPISLILYQVTKRMGINFKLSKNMNSIGIPVNLWDSFSIIARKAT